MKKILLSTLVALSALAVSSPALAQNGNQAIRYQEATDLGYQSAVHSGGSFYGGYVGSSIRSSGNGFCIAGIVCVSHSPRHHVGDLCIGTNGALFGYDDQHHWYLVAGSEGQHEASDGQYVQCDFNGTSFERANNRGGK